MYLVAIGWMYVALMMALAEAFHPQGGVLGAIVTFVLYGVLPVSIVMYVMGTPMRRRARQAAEVAERQVTAKPAHQADAGSPTPVATDMPPLVAAAPASADRPAQARSQM
ncbi:MAG: hypothetical protein RLZZ584_3703 [Pseudomonadota bacterium]